MTHRCQPSWHIEGADDDDGDVTSDMLSEVPEAVWLVQADEIVHDGRQQSRRVSRDFGKSFACCDDHLGRVLTSEFDGHAFVRVLPPQDGA